MSSQRSQTSSEDKPGFRAAEAYIRPSPIVTHGTLSTYVFDLQNCTFTLSLVAESATAEDAPTEIYLPEFHFPATNSTVSVSGGKWTIDTEEVESVTLQRLRWWHGEGEQDIKVQGVKRKAGEILGNADEEGYLDQCQQSTCAVM